MTDSWDNLGAAPLRLPPSGGNPHRRICNTRYRQLRDYILKALALPSASMFAKVSESPGVSIARLVLDTLGR